MFACMHVRVRVRVHASCHETHLNETACLLDEASSVLRVYDVCRSWLVFVQPQHGIRLAILFFLRVSPLS